MEERGRTGRKEGVVFAGPHSSPPVFSFFLPFLPVSAAALGPQAPRLLVGSGMAPGSQPAFGSGPWDPRMWGRAPCIFQTAPGGGPGGRAHFTYDEGGTERPGGWSWSALTPLSILSFLGPLRAPLSLSSFPPVQGRLSLQGDRHPVPRAGAAGWLEEPWGAPWGAGADVPFPSSCGTSRQAGKPREPPQPWHRGRVLLPQLRPGPAGDLLCHPRQVREGRVDPSDRASGKAAPPAWVRGRPPSSGPVDSPPTQACGRSGPVGSPPALGLWAARPL